MTLDIGIMILYLALTLGVGLYGGRKTHTMRDFSIADRKFSTFVLVATLFATVIGGGPTLGATDKMFRSGILYGFITLGRCFNKLAIAYIIAPNIRRFEGSISIGDIMGKLYGNPGRTLTGLTGAITCIGVLGIQISAMGYLFEITLGISKSVGVLIGTGITILYSSLGGIRAVTLTDVLQFSILIVGLPLICFWGIYDIGGMKALWKALPVSHQTFLPHNESLWDFALLFFVLALPKMTPPITQRMLMASDVKQIQRSMISTAILELPIYLIIGILGMLSLAYFPHAEPRLAFLQLIKEFLPIGIRGFAITGILAVIMSSADSSLNASSITFVHDFLKPLFNKNLSDKRELLLTRLTTFLLGSLSIWVALQFQSILDIVLTYLGFWLPVIWFPLMAGILGMRASKWAFLLSASVGLMTFLGCYSLWPHAKTYATCLSTLANVVTFLACWFSQKKTDSRMRKLNNL
ncbi:MAG: hypothetical protein A2Y14_01470 [Verrucomicrobia bacterium GWF2_51_19]|nr:MAG: hypothetical protein A2Y14_01470 [Verrucomicrobia bacterium GWF2_51_19]HCJ12547.1 twin-arginine translocation pathway signal protein [Opitutae bacterium]